jgi:serine protease Do
MTRQAGALVALTAVVSFLLGLVAASTGPVNPTTALPAAPVASLSLPVGAAQVAVSRVPASPAAVDFAEVASRVNGAVVNVDAAARGREEATPRRWSRDFSDDPNAPREGSGSGFIIDTSGFILTNYHVVEGADRVTISLADGRVFRADLVGIDPAIDVALLKIPGDASLPVAVLGDSETLQAGEWVCAIGNPLGYVHSVTVGVVSFLGRKLFDQSLDAFIQTDAAISFGNSGGPLINAAGEVVGMTTAVSAQGSSIGFAIPISQIASVLPQLREYGRVARGYIGVGLTNVTPDLGQALGLRVAHGALVQDVSIGTPGERAGLRSYDVIVAVDGEPVSSDEELIRRISGRQPGSLVSLGLWRRGQPQTMSVKLIERPVAEAPRARDQLLQGVRPAAGREYGPLGISVTHLDRATMTRNRVPAAVVGVMINDVDPAGPARLARLRPGQVLMEINRRAVRNRDDYEALVSALPDGKAAAVLLYDSLVDQRVILTIIPDRMP